MKKLSTRVGRSILDHVEDTAEEFGHNAVIRFEMPNGTTIEIQRRAMGLNIRATDGAIAVLPSASNDLYVMTQPHSSGVWNAARPKRQRKK